MSSRVPDPTGAAGISFNAASLLPALVTVGTALIALQIGSSWLLLLAAVPFGLLMGAVAVPPHLVGLEVTWHGPARCRVGDSVVHHLGAQNRGSRPLSAVRVTHSLPGFEDVTVVVPPLGPGQRAAIAVTRIAVYRSHIDGSVVSLRTDGVFGFLEATKRVALQHLAVVHPALAPVRLPAPGAGDGAESSPVPARHGIDVHGVRDWRAGDAVRDVSWRATARRGRVVVVERELPAEPRLAVLVAGPSTSAQWEELISVVAASALNAVRGDRPVALAANQDGLAPVLDGRETELLDWCAALEDPGWPSLPILEALLRWAGRGGQLLVATPGGLPSTWWRGAQALATGSGVQLGALVLDPVTR